MLDKIDTLQKKLMWYNISWGVFTLKVIRSFRYEWKPKGSYIAVLPGDCAANLIYSATLVKAGTLSFQYQFPSATTIFHITVRTLAHSTENTFPTNIYRIIWHIFLELVHDLHGSLFDWYINFHLLPLYIINGTIHFRNLEG